MTEHTPTEQAWLTKEEAADYLKLKKNTLANYISRKAIKVYRSPTGTVRLRREDLDEFMGLPRG